MSPDQNTEPKVSLGDRQSAGGPIALKGFDFQRAYALTLLVESLPDTAFTAVIVEGAEDVEVRFDREGTVERRAVQVKGYRVTLALAREIIAHFEKLDRDSPGTWREFAIACTGLDAKLQAIHNLQASYRDPQGFYEAEADGILVNTRAELEGKLAAAELPVEFIVQRVTFEPGLPNLAQLEAWVRPRVLDALQRSRPEMTRAAAEDAYRRLLVLVSESTRKSITREEAQTEIASAIEAHPAHDGSGPRVVVEEEVETVERDAEHRVAEIGKVRKGDLQVKAKLGTVKGKSTALKIDELG
jgi:hypothetical protein